MWISISTLTVRLVLELLMLAFLAAGDIRVIREAADRVVHESRFKKSL
ncbi:MAG: hypothetical protein U0795_10625 [Pirellulales bacterium]